MVWARSFGTTMVCAACMGAGAEAVYADVAVDFQIDIGKDNKAISPLIFGSNSDDVTATDGVTLRRSGGNRLTGYNWENNASNAGMDYLNESDAYLGGGDTPGKAMTDFHDKSLAQGAASVMTLPAAGYVAKDKNGPVSKAETAPSARWVKVVFEKNGAYATTPDLTDTAVYTDEFVNFLAKKYGDASSDKGVKRFEVDNEPGLWPSTHPYLHPDKTGAKELVDRTVGVAKAVKKVDPGAEVFGGVFYGYADYNDLQGSPDWKTENPNSKYAWYIDYFLDRMKHQSDSTGKRLLDVLDIHWYSEATADHRINDDTAHYTAKDRDARLQAPRSLWDSTYAESSWISKWATPKQPVTNWNDPTPGPILLLPHIFSSIAKYYPGTRLAITEYDYGEADHVTGGLSTADFLGVLTQNGVYASSFWQLSRKPTFVEPAFRLFRNYDGNKGTYGSFSVAASGSDRTNASVFASFNPGGDEVHIITINKNPTEAVTGNFKVTSPVALSSARVFGFDQTGPALAEKTAIASISGNAFAYTLPPWSAYHFVLKSVSVLPAAGIRAHMAALEAKAMRLGPGYRADGRLSARASGSEAARAPAMRLFTR